MDKEAGKKAAAQAALKFVEEDTVIGVGSGTTVTYFIEALKPIRQKIEGAVASSIVTANQLKAVGIPVIDLNSVGMLDIYIDGADEVNAAKQMIKGGGAALTREKIIATCAKQFVCIVDESKVVDLLGQFPVAIEVIPMARGYVARKIVQLGGDPVYRENVKTDNGNIILDVFNLKITDPKALETEFKDLVGVVESGIFAKRTADVVLVGAGSEVKSF